MPRRCLTCSHPKINEIDSLLHNSQPYSTIAFDFHLKTTNVRYHAVNHVKPIIERANRIAEAKIVKRIVKYREEVNYPILDKIKLAQQELLDQLEAAVLPIEYVGILREYRGWVQEEAKIEGAYTKAKENPVPATPEILAGALYKSLIEDDWTHEDAVEGVLTCYPEIDIQNITGGCE